MARESIPQQLEKDYPGVKVSFDEKRNILVMNNHKISILLDKKELEHVNVNSQSGKNYYQAITQHIYTNFQLVPKKGGFADSLITKKEEYDKFRIQNISKEYGIGFLEDGEDVIAVKVSGDLERTLVIEEGEHLNKNQIADPEDDFAYLVELPKESDDGQ